MVTARLSSKGQLVIPVEIRKAMQLNAGDTVALEVAGDTLVIRPSRRRRATLQEGPDGRPVLKAPRGAPRMTTELVKAILEATP